MTEWFNIKVRTNDPDKVERVLNDLIVDRLGQIVTKTEDVVFACIVNSDRSLNFGVISRRLSNMASSAIVVQVSDTDDGAGGHAYDFENGIEKVRQKASEPGGRHSWPGIRYDGLHVDGGGYF